MTPLEELLAIADEETLILVRNMIGKKQLALLIAKAALADTTIDVSPKAAANVLEMPLSTVKDHLDRIAFKKQSSPR
jgi:hypothetical protein